MNNLVIKNLHVSVDGKEILRGINLTINEGDNVALLGPNGHGKSTLLMAIMGHPKYVITCGTIAFNKKDVKKMSVDERSKLGLFLGLQNPSEVPGVNNSDFLKNILNVRREKPMSLFTFYKELEGAYQKMGIPFEMANRNLNEGFSGGEKKRNEILQMLLLNPKIAMLDEIDSGLDVDAINVVAKIINQQHQKGTALMVISHYARLFDLIHPNRAVIMVNGKIVLDGKADLIKRIDKEGYEWIKQELGIDINKIEHNQVSIGACATKVALKEQNK
ncbi:MAG: Fe-S cluster assembly ATPase SufC [Bacilli bacterium]|nr:Fe-S cluster assembly ATPase SufC [Bacilli bacterium]